MAGSLGRIFPVARVGWRVTGRLLKQMRQWSGQQAHCCLAEAIQLPCAPAHLRATLEASTGHANHWSTADSSPQRAPDEPGCGGLTGCSFTQQRMMSHTTFQGASVFTPSGLACVPDTLRSNGVSGCTNQFSLRSGTLKAVPAGSKA